MTELLTSAQMCAIEQMAMDQGDPIGNKLMGLAAEGVVKAVFKEWPAFAKGTHDVLVLCGPGNNGGDGFAIAYLLRDKGWRVRVHLYGDPDKLPPAAKMYYLEWMDQSEVLPFEPEAVRKGGRPDLIVDAIFGTGLTRPLPQDVAEVLKVTAGKRWHAPSDIRTVAVDCPSGLDLDTGMVPSDFDPEEGDDVRLPVVYLADLTVTFHAPKLGHYLGMGPLLCRKLKVANIRLWQVDKERQMLGTAPDPERARLVDRKFCLEPIRKRIWPASFLSKYREGGHKYDHGHAIVFAGGVGRGGAARLAARSALRSGAGLVTVLCPSSALIENACQLNAVMLRALGKDQALEEVIDARATSFCLGPGMGIGAGTRGRVIEVLDRRAGHSDWRDPAVVLDADALTSFEDDPEELFKHTHARTILTPHEGEFERLFPDLSGPARKSISKVDAARAAAKRAGCLILLKGPDTVIAQPDGGASVHAAVYGREVPWLATAGAGDVLAGMIAGLAAPSTSADLFVMAEIATYLHVEAARRFGPGLIAEDLPEQLPEVFRGLGI